MSAMQADPTTPVDEILIEPSVLIPMRDGTRLAADIFRPATPGRYPVLVERTGYNLQEMVYSSAEYFAHHGYVYVAQDVRGRYGSEGEFRPFLDDGWGENRDGYDTIEWAAAQSWSDGTVGTAGGSYSGLTQYLAAPTRPPHLRTMFVRAGPSALRDVVFRGGAYQRHLQCEWGLRQGILRPLGDGPLPPELEAVRQRAQAAYADMARWYRHLPLRSYPPMEGLANWWFEWLAHPEYGSYWEGTEARRMMSEVDAPIFHHTGWFDIFLGSTLRAFTAIRDRGRTEECRRGQRLAIGPWIHGQGYTGNRIVGDLDFGTEAELDFNAFRAQWFDSRLKGTAPVIPDEPPVRIFLMGANRWLDLADWPPPGVEYRPIYLHAGAAESAGSLNNGSLSFDPPANEEAEDAFAYDPAQPMPSLLLYPQLGPRDHRSVEEQMLTYTSEVFEHDLIVVGPVKAVLYAASSAPDTDWVVRICDVWPDGRSMSVCDGILRARYRNSFERDELMTPGEIYRFEIDLWATAQVFQAGHRLRVEVTSSDFPRYDRNLNTGGVCADETVGQVAVNRIFHDAQHASHVILPLFEPA